MPKSRERAPLRVDSRNRSRRRESAHFSSIIGVLAPTPVGGYDFLNPGHRWWVAGPSPLLSQGYIVNRKCFDAIA